MSEKQKNNGGKPELKADFVEPGNGKNAAYKWVVGKDGKIRVQGSYTKFANSADSDGNDAWDGGRLEVEITEEESEDEKESEDEAEGEDEKPEEESEN